MMPLTLASIFADNMVLQRGADVPIFGRADAGARVTVSFKGQRVTATAGADGRWEARLAPMEASATPAELLVEAAGATPAKLTFRNALVGEVWICSGQSNMEWPISLSNNPEGEIAGAKFPAIRLFTVPKRHLEHPGSDMPPVPWYECSPETISAFSAVGYFFGREIHRELNVPVGLINSSWGGTVAEAWTSRESLAAEPALKKEILDTFAADLPKLRELQEKWKQDVAAIDARTRDTENQGFARGWAGPTETPGDWKDMTLPGTWQSKGLEFSGILWFRKTIDIPAAWVGKDLKLSIGATDKSDVTYFNGEKVGSVTMAQRPDSWSFLRVYTVPGKLVKAGKAVIAVRVYSEKYAAGMTGPTEVMHVSCPDAPATPRIPIAGTWRYAIEANYGPIQLPPAPMGPDNPNAPTVLFNGMIHPLVPYAIRGAVWYQGESNAGRPKQYRTLFKTLIRDWRKQWKNDSLAFHLVQLANYMAVKEVPGNSLWAELREAQTMALALPRTGMAVAIDIGDAGDIHPRNKQDVGKRLAYNALHTTYGMKDRVPCGPLFREAKREGATMRVKFNHTGGGLVSRGDKLQGFAIAGADRSFVWADARIDGDSVIVSSKSVAEPAAVRYAWADNPICNLYNAEGLPASPFRSDVD